MVHETYQDLENGYDPEKDKKEYIEEYNRVNLKAIEISKSLYLLNDEEKQIWINGFIEGYFYNK